MDLDLTPNYSFFIQLITFVVLWQGLKRLVFEPFLRVLDEREKRTVAAKAEAERLLVEVERTRSEYEQSLHRLRVEMAQEAASARNAAQEEGQRALAAARAAANEEMMRMRTQVAAQVDAARSSLATQAEAIAQEMLARVVNGKAA
jgi:F-type H+-transporting ATPase subunit b